MKEIGMINRQIDSALNRQGHMDLMLVSGAGHRWELEVK